MGVWDGMAQASRVLLPLCQQRRLRPNKLLNTLFSLPQNPRSLGGDVASDGDFLIFEGNRYSRKGFLFKSFAMSAVVRVPEGVMLRVVVNRKAQLSPSCSPGPRVVGYLGLSQVILKGVSPGK